MSQIVRYLAGFLPGRNGTESAAPVDPADAMDEAIKQRLWGGSAYGPTGGNYCAESPEVRQRYREMLRDATVKASILSKVWDVAALELQVMPEDEENERDKLIAEFNRDNILNARGGVRALTESILFGALMEGYGLCHVREKTAERGKWAGKTVLDVLRPKDSEFYYFDFDDYRNIAWVVDRHAEDERKRKLAPSDFVITRHLQIFDSPYGMSDLRAADRAYGSLNVVQQIRVVWLEKWKGPFLHGKSDVEKVRNELLEKLKKARGNGLLVTDKLTEVEILNLATGTEEAFQSFCNDCREEIATAITGAFLQMMAGQVPGGRGSSQEHTSQAKLFRWYLAQLVADAINDQIIPRFTDANFAGSPPYPKATLEGTSPDDVLADLEVAALKMDMGGSVDEEELDKRSGWRPGALRKAAPIPIPTNITGAAAAVSGAPPGVQPPGKVPARGKAAAAPNGQPVPAGGAKP